MSDSKAEFQILDFARRKPNSPPAEGLISDASSVSELHYCNDHANEPWTGWRLVLGWSIGMLVGWSILTGAAVVLFKLASWARATW
jgi:hypothetical protein